MAAYCNEMRDPSGLRPGPPHQTALHSMSLHAGTLLIAIHDFTWLDIFHLYVHIFLLLQDESVHLMVYLNRVLHPGRKGNSRASGVACRSS